MRSVLLALSLSAVAAGCSKSSDVASSPSTEALESSTAPSSVPLSQSVPSGPEAAKSSDAGDDFPIPEEQKKFQAMILGLPEIPTDIYGTRREDTFVAETDKGLGDYELQKIRTYDYYVEPKPGKAGLSEVKNWICKATRKKESDEDFGSCELVGMPHSISSDFFWNRGSNFKPNQKYYIGDVLKISARVKSAIIFYQGGWDYKIELQDGSFEVLKEGK